MTDLLEQRREKVDAQWELYARNLRTLQVRVLPGTALIIVSAIAGVWVSPVWSGVVSTPAPHLFAIALAVLSATAFAGFVAVFARFQTAAPPPFIQPRPTSKAAFLLREWSASQQRGAIIYCCAFQAYLAAFAFVGIREAQAAPSASGTLATTIFCISLVVVGVVTAVLVFGVARQQDEFDAAMRGRAAQIGFWSALIILGSALIATTVLGPAILPWLPFGFMLMTVAPGLSFVVLTNPGKIDG